MKCFERVKVARPVEPNYHFPGTGPNSSILDLEISEAECTLEAEHSGHHIAVNPFTQDEVSFPQR